MILTVAAICFGSTGSKAGERRDRDRLVDQVQPVDRGPVEHQEACLLGEQVDPAGERLLDPKMRARNRLGDEARGLVLMDVIGPQPGGDDRADAGRGERRDIVRRQTPALAEDEFFDFHRVGENGALGLGQRQIAEFHAARSCAQDAGHLGHHRERDLGRADRADLEPGRPVDAPEIRRLVAERAQPLEPGRMGPLAAEGRDIEGLGSQRQIERRIVELGVVGQRHDRRARVRLQFLHRLVGPVGAHVDPREAGIARERPPRIDHGDVIAREARHRHQDLRDVHRADHDQAQRRVEDLDEEWPGIGWNRDTFVAPVGGPDRLQHGRRQGRPIHDLASDHERFLALVQPAQVCCRLLGGAGLEQTFQKGAFHGRVAAQLTASM